MAKIYYKKREKFFRERYQEFHKAYYAWARYDPYKKYGKPTYENSLAEAQAFLDRQDMMHKLYYHDVTPRRLADTIQRDKEKKIKEYKKHDKKELRQQLKKAFKNLF